MKTLTIFDQNENGLFEALPKNVSAEVLRVSIGGIKTDFYKLVVSNGENSFLVGVFDNKETATENLLDLHETLKKAQHGKLNYDGWLPTDSDISALDLLEELEWISRKV